MTRKHLYLISGLGADERAFQDLHFPPEYEVHYLAWISPLPNESISSYAARMAESITADGPVSILGLSFGGIMSLEIAKIRPVAQNILISSIKNTREKPSYFNWVLRLHLLQLPDFIIFQNRRFVVERYMDVQSPEEKQLLRDFLSHKDYAYTRWAINVILHWQNEYVPDNLVQINGDKDHPFPIKHVNPTHIIRNGGHFMVMNRAGEISRILAETML